MRLLNHRYHDTEALKAFIAANDLVSEKTLFIQIYVSAQPLGSVYAVRDELLNLLPGCSIVGSTTAGFIVSGETEDEGIVLSFSVFETASVITAGYHQLSVTEVMDRIRVELIEPETKLLVVFANPLRFDATSLLQKIGEVYPNVVLAGGNAGDDYRFERCEVFSTSEDDCDIVFAAVHSSVLKVTPHYLLNWESIGRPMRVTRAQGNQVFDINGKSICSTYRHYLGPAVAENILEYGIQFPLIYKKENVEIARAPIALDREGGSITFAGEISEGTEVKFGYANVAHIVSKNKEMLAKVFSHQEEGIYVYSCAARRKMLGNFLNDELSCLHQIAPLAGFITYGEFFHDAHGCGNTLLNITTTFVTMSENVLSDHVSIATNNTRNDANEVTFQALTTLISRTSQELEENIYYLEQFKSAVNESSIFSIADERGVITEVNDNFIDISGYSREELIGAPHSIVRSEDMPKEVFKEMWSMIQSGKMWKGLVKNRRKDGKNYYVLTEIMPIYYKNGKFRQYIGIRNDVTELEEYKNFLKSELDTTSRNFEESLHYIAQYEKAINSMTAILKTDTHNIIKYANEKFCEISKYSQEELMGTNCEELRHEKHRLTGVCLEIRKKLAAGQLVYETLTNIAKDGSEYVVYSLFYPVLDQEGNVIEHLQVMYDISEIVHLNEEIMRTQKEVVMTMGAIGETRSRETGLHVKRVAEYSYLLAKLYGMEEEEAQLLKQASPMHDIGKVAIPDTVLNKPGRLTPEEFEVMKTHAQLGYEMLCHSQRPILKASAVVAYSHHEKYDGSGYPLGLAKEEIPIFGRITAIADVFDALGHDRVYKKAWEDEKIFALFKEERGRHFDPVLIDLFFEHLEEFLAIRDRLRDE